MVDYFYRGYETYGLDKGIAMLQQHINNPNCLTSKKKQIIKRLEGMEKLAPGALSPNFILQDIEGNNFDFHAYKGKAKYKLLLFWSADCDHCMLLVNSLIQWYNESGNKEKLDIVAVSLDDTETEVQIWDKTIINLTGWKHLRAKGGVNSAVANDYAILSTPVLFLIKNENNIIEDLPANLDQLIKDLENK
jgi:peroxiredoxin